MSMNEQLLAEVLRQAQQQARMQQMELNFELQKAMEQGQVTRGTTPKSGSVFEKLMAEGPKGSRTGQIIRNLPPLEQYKQLAQSSAPKAAVTSAPATAQPNVGQLIRQMLQSPPQPSQGQQLLRQVGPPGSSMPTNRALVPYGPTKAAAGARTPPRGASPRAAAPGRGTTADIEKARAAGRERVNAAKETLKNTPKGSMPTVEGAGPMKRGLRTAGRVARGAARVLGPASVAAIPAGMAYDAIKDNPDQSAEFMISALRRLGGWLGNEAALLPGISESDLPLLDQQAYQTQRTADAEAASGGLPLGAPAPVNTGAGGLQQLLKDMLASSGPRTITSEVPGGPMMQYPMQEFLAPEAPDYAGAVDRMGQFAPQRPAPRNIRDDVLRGIAEGGQRAIGGVGSDVWLSAGLGALGGRASGNQAARAEQQAFEQQLREFGLSLEDARLQGDVRRYSDELGLIDRKNSTDETNIGRMEKQLAQLQPQFSGNTIVQPTVNPDGTLTYRVQRVAGGNDSSAAMERMLKLRAAQQSMGVEDFYEAALAQNAPAMARAIDAALGENTFGSFREGNKPSPEQISRALEWMRQNDPENFEQIREGLIIQQLAK